MADRTRQSARGDQNAAVEARQWERDGQTEPTERKNKRMPNSDQEVHDGGSNVDDNEDDKL